MKNSVELTNGAAKKLRLCKVFKTLSSITYEDIFSYPWKVPFLIVPTPLFLGTMVTLGTMGYYLVWPSDKAREARQKIKKSMTHPPRVRVYKDFMRVCPKSEQQLDMSTYQMLRYMAQWNIQYVKSKIHMRELLKSSHSSHFGFMRAVAK